MVPTDTMIERLTKQRFEKLAYWSRGVDGELFRPRSKSFLSDKRPIYLYAGRVAPEKNIDAFLKLKLPGTKYVVGAGPSLKRLKAQYPDAHYTGYVDDETLAAFYAAADVFVFPSRRRLSASSCSKRWRAACRSRPIRSPGRSMSSATAAPARSKKISPTRSMRR